jgi:hypothetical protein
MPENDHKRRALALQKSQIHVVRALTLKFEASRSCSTWKVAGQGYLQIQPSVEHAGGISLLTDLVDRFLDCKLVDGSQREAEEQSYAAF